MLLTTLRASLRTDPGRVRDDNQDAAHVDPRGRFIVLADGMGGPQAGAVASAMAIELIRADLDAAHELAAYDTAPDVAKRPRVGAILDAAVRRCNEAIYRRACDDPRLRGMGTTLEVVALLGGELFAAHVGDSRTYVIRNGVAIQTAMDHTVAEVLRRAGSIGDEEEATSPMHTVLANAVGIGSDLTIDHSHLALRPGDRVLVCSDGLHRNFTAASLALHASEGRVDQALAALVVQARVGGGEDNITGVLAEIGYGERTAVDPFEDRTTVRFLPLQAAPPAAGDA